MARPIPALNLYYMLCYAWDRFEQGRVLGIGGTNSPGLHDLLASVLATGVLRLARRGLDRGYLERTEITDSPRGRIAMRESLPLLARNAPALACCFDERLPDVPHNRVLRAALARLDATSLDPMSRRQVRAALASLAGATIVPLAPSAFRAVQLNRNNAPYDLLLHMSRLVMDATLPEPGGTQYRFTGVANDEASMRGVFEAFVRTFLSREQSRWQPVGRDLAWDAPGPAPLLPAMRTDIHLASGPDRLVIDTKYTVDALQEYRGIRKLRSDHLYQLFAYLRNLDARTPPGGEVRGMLLYPAAGDAPLDVRTEIQGHPIRVVTLDLCQPWTGIHRDLLATLRW